MFYGLFSLLQREHFLTESLCKEVLATFHLKRINKRKLKCSVRKMVSLKCFSGARTKQIDYYIVPTLLDETPETIVIRIGSNDIAESKIKQINLDDLAQKIIDIGLKCRSYGVRNIAISSILVRSSIRLNQIILKGNNKLKVLLLQIVSISYVMMKLVRKCFGKMASIWLMMEQQC